MSSFPFYHQHDSMQCGVTCLQMVCKYHGKEYSPEALSRYCFATTEGVSLLAISEAATRLGMHTLCGKVTIEQLQEAYYTENLPMSWNKLLKLLVRHAGGLMNRERIIQAVCSHILFEGYIAHLFHLCAKTLTILQCHPKKLLIF